VDPAREIIELDPKTAEQLLQIDPGKALQLATFPDLELFQSLLHRGADSPDLAHWKFGHERGDLVRLHFELAIRLVHVARDLGNELVRTDAGRGGKPRFPQN